LKVNTSDNLSKARTATKSGFNKGWALLKSSLIVGALLLVEFIIATIFRVDLNVGIAYPIVILALALGQFAVFATLYLKGYGKNARKSKSHNYLTVSIVFTCLAVLIICVFALLLDVNFSSSSEVIAKIVLPIIIALNVPLFSLSYFYFSK
jgi:LytS/YehU family sensor histidine kinase